VGSGIHSSDSHEGSYSPDPTLTELRISSLQVDPRRLGASLVSVCTLLDAGTGQFVLRLGDDKGRQFPKPV
jgi:hypothetical protein